MVTDTYVEPVSTAGPAACPHKIKELSITIIILRYIPAEVPYIFHSIFVGVVELEIVTRLHGNKVSHPETGMSLESATKERSI